MSETVPVDAGWVEQSERPERMAFGPDAVWSSWRSVSGRLAEASDMVDGIVPPNEKPDRGATGNPLGQKIAGEICEKL